MLDNEKFKKRAKSDAENHERIQDILLTKIEDVQAKRAEMKAARKAKSDAEKKEETQDVLLAEDALPSGWNPPLPPDFFEIPTQSLPEEKTLPEITATCDVPVAIKKHKN